MVNSLIDVMSLLKILVPIFLLLFIGVIIILNVRETVERRRTNKQPVLTVPAKVFAKRTQVLHHIHQFEIHLYYPTSTYYFVTFEMENGEKVEFEMNGIEFSQITEGDEGKLVYQGKDFLQFIIEDNE